MKNYLIDKLILFLFTSTIMLYYYGSTEFTVLSMLLSIIIVSIGHYWDDELFTLCLYGIFCVLCFWVYPSIIYSGLIVYSVFQTKYKFHLYFFLFPLAACWRKGLFTPEFLFFIFLIFLLSLLLSYRSERTEHLTTLYKDARDDLQEKALRLSWQNSELLEKQDNEIHMAILQERNRIAREMHDNVGHMLSRSLLQIGAMTATCKDDNQKQTLNALKDTLNTAMTSIRESVHDMHEDSIDLNLELNKLIQNFTFCPIHYEYDMNAVPPKLKYTFLAIVKEALNNIMKHSKATRVDLIFREHPALFQILIVNNGVSKAFQNLTDLEFSSGIGLKNIKDRVENLGGTINITQNKGFRIFISIPKQNKKR